MKFRLGMTLVALAVVAAGCGDDDDNGQNPANSGGFQAITVTTGVDLDDSYELYYGTTTVGAIGANDQATVEDLTPGDYSVGLNDVAANCSVTGSNPATVSVERGVNVDVTFNVVCTALNQPPTADAGPDQTVTDTDDSGSEDVTLDGSASTDADGTIVSWSWTVEGTEIATTEMATVTFDVGTYTVVLTVTDNDGATGSDNVMITVEAAPEPVSFATEILPYFAAGQAGCVACHSGGTGQNGVNLDSYANIMAGGTNGPLVVANEPDNATALLVPQLEASHFDGPDDANFVVTLKQWISEGALDN